MEEKNYKKLFEICTSLSLLSEIQIMDSINVIDDETGKNHLIDYAYILHNMDIKKDGTKVEPHWHIFVRMDNSYSFEYIANRFHVPVQQVQAVKTRFSNCLNYLTHNTEDAKKEGKHLYDDNEVKSNFEWKKERQKAIDSENKKNRKQEIIKLIANGTIRKFNYFNFITISEYDVYKKSIDNAFSYRIDKLKGVNREMECIFITGNSGSGKTTYAKMYAESLGYSVFVSSGSNDVLDDYAGQDCIILDDLRPSCMGLSDLLKMLDNHSSSTVKSRYKNKVLECKLIIITTVLDLNTFFGKVFSEEKEPILQLKRRCTTKITMDNETMKIALFDEAYGDYGNEIEYENPIKDIFTKKTFKTTEEYKKATEKFNVQFKKD